MSPPYDKGRPGGGGLSVVEQQQNDGVSVAREPVSADRCWRVSDEPGVAVVQDVGRRRWVEAVDATRLVPTQTRLLLRQYGDRMGADGLVWESRKQLAERLGVDERTVQRAFVAARRAGLLRYVGGGWNGRTTEHHASVPVIGHPNPERLPVAPTPPWETRRETGRETARESEPNSHRVSLQPAGRETAGVSPREVEGEPREHVALEDDADGEPTTTAAATAVTTGPGQDGNEREGQQDDSRPLLASAVPHACEAYDASCTKCQRHQWSLDLLWSLYDREAA